MVEEKRRGRRGGEAEMRRDISSYLAFSEKLTLNESRNKLR